MQTFVPAAGGWESAVEQWECELVSSLVEQLLYVLTSEGAGARSGPSTSQTGQRSTESERDSAILASLDFQADDGEPQQGAVRSPQEDAELAPLLEVLLPDASEDPLTAVEVASMEREHLRSLKADRARLLLLQLREPSGQEVRVRVEQGQEQEWLGAVNDLRLVLAQRLGIESAEDAEEAHAVAWEDPPRQESEEARSRRAMSMVYDMLTWWQESLLTVMLSDDAPA
ncbi:DUF2017 family protein [Actinomyces faecalis]|uniref:DUF2017 family protein n=1 Tax=Actinomyces faecalis TaxID=2722820 RepID=UPI001556E6D1|nr:DUF2017 family protein [Actinomyces faecalis]